MPLFGQVQRTVLAPAWSHGYRFEVQRTVLYPIYTAQRQVLCISIYLGFLPRPLDTPSAEGDSSSWQGTVLHWGLRFAHK